MDERHPFGARRFILKKIALFAPRPSVQNATHLCELSIETQTTPGCAD